MTAIAFIGLGIMGSPMAVHLQNAGHQVAGYNKSPGKAGTAGRGRRARGRRRSPTPSRALRWWPSWSRTRPMSRPS